MWNSCEIHKVVYIDGVPFLLSRSIKKYTIDTITQESYRVDLLCGASEEQYVYSGDKGYILF